MCFWQWINFFRPTNRSCDFRLFVSSAFSLPLGFVRFYSVSWALLFFLSLSLFRPRRARKLLVSSYIQFQLHVPRGTDALDAGPSVSLPSSPPSPFLLPSPCHRMQHSGTSEYAQLALSLSLSLVLSGVLRFYRIAKKQRLSYCFNGSCVLRASRTAKKNSILPRHIIGFLHNMDKLRVLNCILCVEFFLEPFSFLFFARVHLNTLIKM